jgi:twitching motility protein PilU
MDQLFKLLARTRELGATDLLLSCDIAPALRIDGILTAADKTPITANQIDKIAAVVMNESQRRNFETALEMNLGISFDGLGRFRVNLFRQRGRTAMAFRAIPPMVPTFADLGLPDTLKDISMLKRGLVLFVGACGSGKSTSLAAMLDHRNHHDKAHIITIEDPIEYQLSHRESMVNQREIGADTHSYHDALINALRQSPDVLMIGEIRDRETMERAIEFSDIGHLCLSTLHANNAYQAFDRIINMFEEREREQVLMSLAHNVRAIISQRLVPTLAGRRTSAYELLINSPRISEIVRRGEFEKIMEAMQRGEGHGMVTFDDCLYNLYAANVISGETALAYADSVSNLRLRMKLAAHGDTGT